MPEWTNTFDEEATKGIKDLKEIQDRTRVELVN